MTPPDSEARKPTLTSTTVMRRPLLCRCSMTNMRSPTAPWTKSEEKRHHRKTQYHISGREETGDKGRCLVRNPQPRSEDSDAMLLLLLLLLVSHSQNHCDRYVLD